MTRAICNSARSQLGHQVFHCHSESFLGNIPAGPKVNWARQTLGECRGAYLLLWLGRGAGERQEPLCLGSWEAASGKSCFIFCLPQRPQHLQESPPPLVATSPEEG